MTVRDVLVAGVRTAVQAGVGLGLAYAAREFGISLDLEQVQLLVDAVVIGAVTAGLAALGNKFPVVNTILSFGLSKTGPNYGN